MHQQHLQEGTEESHQFHLFEDEPTEEEIIFFAKKMGMHPIRDKKYLYLAREGEMITNCRIAESIAWWLASC